MKHVCACLFFSPRVLIEVRLKRKESLSLLFSNLTNLYPYLQLLPLYYGYHRQTHIFNGRNLTLILLFFIDFLFFLSFA